MNIKQKELSVRQNMIWNMAGSVVGMACQWLISIIVVRLATDLSSAGLYSLAMSVFAIFSPIANFGMYTYIVTDMEERNTSGEYITISLFTSLAAVLITTLYAAFTCRPNALPIVFSYALYKGIVIVIDIIHAIDQKAHRMDYIGISLGIQGVLTLISFTAVFGCTQDLTTAILSMAFVTLTICFAYDLPRASTLSHINLGISPSKAMGILAGCVLIVIANTATGASASMPRQFLSTIMGDAALGIYASVATPVAIVQVCSTYIYNPLIGYFAESFHAKDRRSFTRLALFTLFGIMAMGLLSYLGALLAGKSLLTMLYGAEVASHSDLLGLLLLSSVLLGVSSFLCNLLVAVRALQIMTFGSIAALGLAILTSPYLITSFGMNGATTALLLASSASITISCIGIFTKARNRFSLAGNDQTS